MAISSVLYTYCTIIAGKALAAVGRLHYFLVCREVASSEPPRSKQRIVVNRSSIDDRCGMGIALEQRRKGLDSERHGSRSVGGQCSAGGCSRGLESGILKQP